MMTDVKPGMTVREFLLAEAEGGAAAKIRTAPPDDLLESIATERRAYTKRLDEIRKAAEEFARMAPMPSLSDEFRALLDEPMYCPPVLPVARSAHNQNREMPHPRPPAAPTPAPSASAPAVAQPKPAATATQAETLPGAGIVRHALKSRRDPLAAVFARAKREATDSACPHSVWAALVAMATGSAAPPELPDYREDKGIQATGARGGWLSKSAFMDRWRRGKV